MTRMMAPVLWYGGKGPMVAKLLPMIPYSQIYVEPYGGAGSIFWNREPSPVEVYNDLDGRLVNLFRILQDPDQCAELQRRIEFTLYSLDEFKKSIEILQCSGADPIEAAWAFFVNQNQGFAGTGGKTPGNWGRAFGSNRGMAETTSKWLSRSRMFSAWHERIARAQIDSRDALEVISYWDSTDTVLYLDPPYIASTRAAGSRDVYAHEQPDSHHSDLVEAILACQGAVVLSGYDHHIYSPLASAGWTVTQFRTACSAAGRVRGSGLLGAGASLAKVPRTEVIWQNPRAVALCAAADGRMLW